MAVDNPKLADVIRHIEGCGVCQRANKRVNDFCALGRTIFAEYTKTAIPIRVEEVILTDEQFERLLAEAERAQKSGREN